MAMARHGWLLLMALLATGTAGCTTRSHAKADAQAAFEAGQRCAFQEVGARQNGISFRGPVLHPVVTWTEGITLGTAMAAAGWRHAADPQLIILVRGSETFEMTPKEALEAASFPLEQGDVVEMIP